ncbi:MAG: hypothetical protein KME18_07065 [Phormidium tanganyikae FI6-MK23]|jgi:hypothetical protein|nr:hypothetical protein [Phormidium tanganyikae FI6-MK23]
MKHSRKKCVVFANCQADLIKTCLQLSKEFVEQYEMVEVPLNFQAIAQNFVFSDELLRDIDLFIYQPLKDQHGSLSTNSLLPRLHDRCVQIGFPYLYFKGYYPQTVDNPLAKPSAQYPYGRFPYGDRFIIEWVEAGKSYQQIVDQLSQTDFYEKDFLLNQVEQSLKELAKRESSIEIKISAFIRQNYQQRLLFDTLNHPTSIIGIEVTNQILQILNLPLLPQSICDRYHSKTAPLLNTWLRGINRVRRQIKLKPFTNFYPKFSAQDQVPIYPSVAAHLNLSFITERSTYKINGCRKKVTFQEYIAAYLTQYESLSVNL